MDKTELNRSVQDAILEERMQREAAADRDQFDLIAGGERQWAVENLVFFTSPRDFRRTTGNLLTQIENDFDRASERLQVECLSFLVILALALRSTLPRWNLLIHRSAGEAALDQDQLDAVSEEIIQLINLLAAQAPQVEQSILAALQAEAVARFKAEQAANPQEAARLLVGGCLADYLRNAAMELSRSQFRRIAEMRFDGLTTTELSNDYAAFLQHALYLGASFATTNPPLINMAWDLLPATWDPVLDALIAAHPGASASHLAKLLTLEVVLAQMRTLRPIFLLTEGRMGCVCFQVDPNLHGDAPAMAADALFFYEIFTARLGGIPNVVFKLPGTQAGLEACQELTRRGIGVTITVNFGMFQQIPFARAIQDGSAIFSCLVEMNGRLAFPVRDELLGKPDELAVDGIDEGMAREAAAWAGVAVAKRLYKLLVDQQIDQDRCKILIASLRIYQGEAYQGLPSAFPDITEITGARLLSVFPNVRHAFEKAEEVDIHPVQIESPVPEPVLEILAHSEIFKQAYHVSNPEWLPQEDGRFAPAKELALEDVEAVFDWAPVHNTLVEFMHSYNTLIERIAVRQQEGTP